MWELLKDVAIGPIPNLLIVAGAACLFIALAGRIIWKGKPLIEVERGFLLAVGGVLLVAAGVGLHLYDSIDLDRSTTTTTTTTTTETKRTSTSTSTSSSSSTTIAKVEYGTLTLRPVDDDAIDSVEVFFDDDEPGRSYEIRGSREFDLEAGWHAVHVRFKLYATLKETMVLSRGYKRGDDEEPVRRFEKAAVLSNVVPWEKQIDVQANRHVISEPDVSREIATLIRDAKGGLCRDVCKSVEKLCNNQRYRSHVPTVESIDKERYKVLQEWFQLQADNCDRDYESCRRKCKDQGSSSEE